MSESDIATVLCAAPCIAFWGGVFVGLMYSNFVYEDRTDTNRFPRPGTQSTRPERFKPFRRHPDMLVEEENPEE